MQKTLEQYYDALDEAEFEAAAGQFTEDVTYIHPPTYSNETKIQGRDSLLTYFRDVRGPTDTIHHIDRVLTDESACAAVGYATHRGDDEPFVRFVAYAEFEGEHIAYYIAGVLDSA